MFSSRLAIAGLLCAVACAPSSSRKATSQSSATPQTLATTPPEATTRSLQLDLLVTIDGVPSDGGPVHLWIPLPRQTPWQTVLGVQVEGMSGGQIVDPVHHNTYWHGVIEEPDGEPVQVHAVFQVQRRPVSVDLSLAQAGPLTAAEASEHSLYLAGSSKVPVGRLDPVLEPVLNDVRSRAGSRELPKVARAIYDHVIDTMEYKKVGVGWGEGDTYWACSERYGNCTDFHSLYLSLARTEGIPARFEMGYPIPLDRDHGDVGGYHCWLRFWLPGVGWVPLDASEADKHPERRDALYGAQAADRVLFTVGRDLRLGPDHKGDALNYFIYPYAEVAGSPFAVQHRLSYKEVE